VRRGFAGPDGDRQWPSGSGCPQAAAPVVASSTLLTFETCCWCCRPSGSGGRHVKDEHVKDAAQDGSVKVFIFSIVIFQWRRTGALLVDPRVRACAATGSRRRRHIGPPSRTTITTAAAATAAARTLRTRRRALRGTCHRTWRKTWPSGPGRRVPSSRRHHRHRRRLCAARAEIAAQLGSSVAFAVLRVQLGSSVAFGSGCGQALPGVPRKAPLCEFPSRLLLAARRTLSAG